MDGQSKNFWLPLKLIFARIGEVVEYVSRALISKVLWRVHFAKLQAINKVTLPKTFVLLLRLSNTKKNCQAIGLASALSHDVLNENIFDLLFCMVKQWAIDWKCRLHWVAIAHRYDKKGVNCLYRQLNSALFAKLQCVLYGTVICSNASGPAALSVRRSGL